MPTIGAPVDLTPWDAPWYAASPSRTRRRRNRPASTPWRHGWRSRRSGRTSDPWDSVVPGVTEAETPPSEPTSQYPPPSGVAAMPTIGARGSRAAPRSVEAGVTEREDAAVGADQPVPTTVRGGGHADDRLRQLRSRPPIRSSRRHRTRRRRRRRRPSCTPVAVNVEAELPGSRPRRRRLRGPSRGQPAEME